MPKNEMHSGTKKRFHMTGSGRVMHERVGTRHLLKHKPSRKTRRLATDQVLENANIKRVKRLFGK